MASSVGKGGIRGARIDIFEAYAPAEKTEVGALKWEWNYLAERDGNVKFALTFWCFEDVGHFSALCYNDVLGGEGEEP